MKKIYIVYKITNTITGDFYIGHRDNIKKSLANHKCQSVWIAIPNDQLYQDMQKYGDDKFVFEILEEVEIDKLKEVEQQYIETLKPTYNQVNANGLDIERYKECKKEYRKSNKYKESHKKSQNKYDNQLCLYEDKIFTLCVLASHFRKAGIDHPFIEAKKYLLEQNI